MHFYNQTKIDSYFKVVSKINTGNGIKVTKRKNRLIPPRRRTKRDCSNSLLKESFVKSDVTIIFENMNQEQQRGSATVEVAMLSSKEQKLHENHCLGKPAGKENLNDSSQLKTPTKLGLNSTQESYVNSKSPKISSTQNYSPKKVYYKNIVNSDHITNAMSNYNLVLQKSITPVEIDLETVYKINDFEMFYHGPMVEVEEKFELSQINHPGEKNADYLVMIIAEVFSNPLNCGYFYEEELKFIFSFLKLKAESQMLFVRLLKRKLSWHRACNIKYPEIANDLTPFFDELIEKNFCMSDTNNVDTMALLNILNVDEVRNICKNLKIPHTGNKSGLIAKLLKYGNSKKSMFIGAKSPSDILKLAIASVSQRCICISQSVIELFDRILVLYNPVQDPSANNSDIFFMLINVKNGELIYPVVPKKILPLFKNRLHLINFVESKNSFKELIQASEQNDWNKVRCIGDLALSKIENFQTGKENSLCIPLHIKKFLPEYMWRKILSKSIDGFKRDKNFGKVVEILKILIDDDNVTQSTKGKWYNEWALIEMHHMKNLESSALLMMEALELSKLTDVDKLDFLDRIRKILKRKTGVSKNTKDMLNEKYKYVIGTLPDYENIPEKTIFANMADRVRLQSGGKSTWAISGNNESQYYGSVEMLALQDYTSQEDYHRGLHCEGSLPVTLFALFFWEEIYNVSQPGAFVSSHQEAPLDLFTSEFYENRKESIDKKIEQMGILDVDTFGDIMKDKYAFCKQYSSIMSNNLFADDEQLKELILCIGIQGVLDISKRLLVNFSLWKSGFPDLILWNPLTLKCKIVEVKGPGDTLSTKQKLWLKYLEMSGLDVEVCHVQARARSSK